VHIGTAAALLIPEGEQMTDTERLQLLEDREEIRQIFVDYARYLDAGDHAGYASLFAADGVLAAQLGEAVGPAAIEAILDENLGPRVRGHLPPAIHVMANHDIHVDGHQATATVVWYYMTTDADACPTILQSGRYRDDLVREGGRWKIRHHEISRAMGRSPMDAAPATRLDAMATRLQVLEDKDAIWGLFMEYKRHLDARDFKAYSMLFTDDAVWVGNLGKATGPAEIEALLERTMEVYPSDRERTHHLVMNPVIEVSGDTATALSNWGYVTRSETDAPVFEMLGHYVDELVRTPAGWRFQRREAYSDIPYISLDGIL
jgi:ketosteroid isomerase-like protein